MSKEQRNWLLRGDVLTGLTGDRAIFLRMEQGDRALNRVELKLPTTKE